MGAALGVLAVLCWMKRSAVVAAAALYVTATAVLPELLTPVVWWAAILAWVLPIGLAIVVWTAWRIVRHQRSERLDALISGGAYVSLVVVLPIFALVAWALGGRASC